MKVANVLWESPSQELLEKSIERVHELSLGECYASGSMWPCLTEAVVRKSGWKIVIYSMLFIYIYMEPMGWVGPYRFSGVGIS